MAQRTPVGRTRDAGWEIGVSRTVDDTVEDVWGRLMSPEGLAVWLGDLGDRGLPQTVGEPYTTADGTRGEVRGYRPLDRVRVTVQPPGAAASSTVQIALSSTPNGRARVTFHQERLADGDERERRRTHWTAVAERLLGL